jgi:hypothetical protein
MRGAPALAMRGVAANMAKYLATEAAWEAAKRR